MNKIKLLTILILLGCAGKNVTKQTRIITLNKQKKITENKIIDPYKYVWVQGEGEYQGMMRFYLDINDDNIPDLFLMANALRGSGGGTCHVFLINESGYRYIGILSLHEKGFELLPTSHNGLRDIKSYWRMGGEEGNLGTCVFNGKKYISQSSERIKSRDYESRITPTNVIVEYSGEVLK
ncbi:MAG: hypothetical protein ABII20_03125, partial [Candidatus Omnitrophota bacterium]